MVPDDVLRYLRTSHIAEVLECAECGKGLGIFHYMAYAADDYDIVICQACQPIIAERYNKLQEN